MTENKPSLPDYFRIILGGPLGAWWVFFTAIIGVLSWVATPDEIIDLHKYWLPIILGVFSLAVFTGISVVIKAWGLYKGRFEKVHVKRIVNLNSERVFLLESARRIEMGSVFELFRSQDSLEISIGFLETVHENADGTVQAKALWMLPLHRRDLELGRISIEHLIIFRSIKRGSLIRWVNEQTTKQIDELLKRGIGGALEEEENENLNEGVEE